MMPLTKALCDHPGAPYPVTVRNDVLGCEYEVEVPRTRPEIVESFLFIAMEDERRPCPDEPYHACFHIYRDRIVLHFYPGADEAAAVKAMKARFQQATP